MSDIQKPALTGAFELFSKSSALVQKNIPTFATLYLLPFLMSLSLQRSKWSKEASFSFVPGTQGFPTGAFLGFGLIIGLIALAVWLVVNAMTYGLLIQTATGKTPKLDDLWVYAKQFWWKLLLLGIVVGFVVIFGLILFIIPGVIFFRRYYLAPYVLVDNKDIGIFEAMKKSAALSKPYSGYVWSIIGVSFLLSLPSMIPIFGWVITFVLTVLYSVAPALRYQELKKLA